ncbi:MAG: primosomal protein N' [Oscillospiraceae bacterium]|nr:primosomal protein N' [Oscillospiraceae bacterium]
MNYALVAVEKTAYSFDRLFAYRVPAELTVEAGVRVLVPFGPGKRPPRVGVVFRVCAELPEDADERKLKEISAVLDAAPLLLEDTLATAAYIRERCFCTWYEAVSCQMPVGLRQRVRRAFIAAPTDDAPNAPLESEALSPATKSLPAADLSADERQILDLLKRRGSFVREDSLQKALGISANSSELDSLLRRGLVIESAEATREIGEASARTARLINTENEPGKVKLTQKQQEVVELLQEFEALTVREICAWTGYTPAVVLALEKKGLLEVYDSALYRIPEAETVTVNAAPAALTAAQKQVCRALWNQYRGIEKPCRGEHCSSAATAAAPPHSPAAGTALLYGVTGSGKTQVYLAMAEAVLKTGRGVMLLVPEIALTPQLLAQVQARLGARCNADTALFHSALAAGERADAWRRVLDGKANIVVGTRSAVFAPLENIGLIVLDEEQEDSYKSGSAPRYDARAVAKFRAKRHGALLLLGSATPGVDSYGSVNNEHTALYTLPERYGNAVMPQVQIVDMAQDSAQPSLFSGELCRALTETLARGEQAVLLLNRRGYNTFAVCRKCRTVVTCPQCSISLTYHAAENRLLCHYCGYARPFSTVCENCHNPGVQYSGFGTQRVEEQLASLLPQARVVRMDADTVTQKGSHARILESFRNREFDILLGTQMVAKGLDFENVTLVGVLSVDSQLHDDDYRSLERTFSLLTQVVGRAGRGEKRGRAILQTLTPEETTLELAARQDYPAFFSTEIALRKALVYPPFCVLYVIGFACENRTAAESAARFALDFLSAHNDAGKMIILGPMPARIEKVGGKFRYRLILKTRSTPQVRALLSDLLITLGKSREYSGVSVSVGRNSSDN